MHKICPNFGGCRLVKTDIVEPDSDKKEQYIETYCLREETWKQCRRYTIRRALWICPDFVLPDSDMTEDEVADLYEQQENTKNKPKTSK